MQIISSRWVDFSTDCYYVVDGYGIIKKVESIDVSTKVNIGKIIVSYSATLHFRMSRLKFSSDFFPANDLKLFIVIYSCLIFSIAYYLRYSFK